jgi:hypothetical protein
MKGKLLTIIKQLLRRHKYYDSLVGAVEKYNLADRMTKHVKSTHVDKLLETGVVDHPVEEHVTRAQMTHDSPMTGRTCRPLMSQSSLAPRADTQQGLCRLPSTRALRMF